jgi:cobaltochelatase CobT
MSYKTLPDLLNDTRLMQAMTAAAQAIAGKTPLSIRLNNQAAAQPLEAAEDAINVANATTDDGADLLRWLRGQSDLAALTLRHHAPATHRTLRPQEPKAAEVFDRLEQVRIEAGGAKRMPGMRHNLDHRMEVWCNQQGYAHLSPQADPPLADLLAVMLRERLTGTTPPAAMQPLLKHWAPWIEAEAGDALTELARNPGEQAEFAEKVLTLLEDLALLPKRKKEGESAGNHADEGPAQQEPQAGEDDRNEEEEEESSEAQETQGLQPDLEGADVEESEEDSSGSRQRDIPASGEPYRPNYPAMSAEKVEHPYRIFTTAYDEVVNAEALAGAQEMQELRTKLDEALARHRNLHTRLAGRLRRLLMARQMREWQYDQEDGLIDNARLARLIIHPDMRHIYKTENEAKLRDTVVTLLIDNSGSMRGRPVTIAAISADILTRTLERCGVKVEVLGFTTRDWKGGYARKQWEQSGKPAHPGRLNDLRHIIYKSAETRLNKVRRNLGLMLKDGLLKENIDGEALIWAYQRLLARPEERRILMVISDGAPVDDSTLSTNASNYLDRHLREVITQIEQTGAVELLAIGIGHDVTRYYQHAVTIYEAEQLADTMMNEMWKLFKE